MSGDAHDILTCADMDAADAQAVAAGTPTAVLVERAGRFVAKVIVGRFEPRPTTVLVGPGNNGADGYVAAQALVEAGWPQVAVEVFAPPKTEAAKAAAALWRGAARPFGAGGAPGDLVIDALFGAGLDRPLPVELARATKRLNESPGLVVSVDVPSGVSGDTGAVLGPASFRAGLTITFHRKKPAHVLQPARALCGEVIVGEIGLVATASRLVENDPDTWLARFPWPSASAYKSSRGHLLVISGDAWSTGAARLSARAGLRVGAGVVTLLSPPEALMVNAAHLEAIMLQPFETPLELEDAASEVEAVVIGPAAGVTEATVSNVLALARTGAALVVDADALTAFRDEPGALFSALDRDDVLTPHPGEFERIFPGLLKQSRERISAAREAARRAQTIVLLKGSDTVIAAPDGRAAVNVNGPPWLATAGSGDVLAGLIGGLIAQGMESFESACAGAWIHGACAGRFGPGLVSEDLPGLVPMVLKHLWERAARLPGRAS